MLDPFTLIPAAFPLVFVCMGFIFILFVVLVIVMIVIGAQQAKKRREALTAWARANRLSFTASRDSQYDDRYPDFQALKRGSSRYAYNIMVGERNGRRVQCFDYHYTTSSTDSKGRRKTTHHHFSAVILTHGLPFPSLFIRPEGFLDKVTEFFGADDIDFELDAFSRAFYVKGPDRRFAYDLIHPDTMEFMLRTPKHTMDFEGPAVMVYTGRRFDPAEYDRALALAEGMLDRLPESVRRELEARR